MTSETEIMFHDNFMEYGNFEHQLINLMHQMQLNKTMAMQISLFRLHKISCISRYLDQGFPKYVREPSDTNVRNTQVIIRKPKVKLF